MIKSDIRFIKSFERISFGFASSSFKKYKREYVYKKNKGQRDSLILNSGTKIILQYLTANKIYYSKIYVFNKRKKSGTN